ncbi:MAG TPA: sensor histidine kinase [Clostridiales bacterium]|nr:sensor histidine kinase [Clostridiales bacterium]
MRNCFKVKIKVKEVVKGIGITWKLVFSNMLLIILSICFLSVVAVKVSRNILVSQVSQNNLEAISQVNKSVNLILDNMVERLNTLYVDENFMNKFRKYCDMDREEYEKLLIQSSTMLNDYYFLMDKLAATAFSAKIEGYYMFVVTQEAIPYASWGRCEQDLTEFTKECSKLFYDNHNKIMWLTTHRTIADSMYYPDDTKTFSAIKRISDHSQLKTLGYMVLSISERNLYNTYENLIQKKEGSTLYIIDEQGNQVSGMCEEEKDRQLYRQIYEELSSQTQKNNKGYFFGVVDGQQHLITYNTIYRNNWNIVYITPFEELMSPIKFLQAAIILAILVAFAIAFIMSFFISHSISKRLSSLRNVMLKQGENGPMTHARVDYNDEIGDLILCYNQMADRINNYSDMLLEEQKKKREMELSFLQMQINSHFLYNTLNSVKILARLNMNDEIGYLITSLIKLLKLTSSKTDLITIEQEIENVRHYVYIQKIRYLDRFEIEYNYEPWVANYQIPKLLMQPVIENAIFHGISDMEGKGIITVKVERDGNDIYIRISDNGKGISEDVLQNILTGYQKMNSIGLHNIDERVKIYFGQEYGVSVETEIGKGTMVAIKIRALPV